MDLSKVFSGLSHLKLSGGVFGKHGFVHVVLLLACGAVAYKTESDWVRVTLLAGAMALIWYSNKRGYDFADKNPFAAIMDGADLLKREEIVHAMKGVKVLPHSEAVIDHEPEAISEFDPDAADPLPLEGPKSQDEAKLPGESHGAKATHRPPRHNPEGK